MKKEIILWKKDKDGEYRPTKETLYLIQEIIKGGGRTMEEVKLKAKVKELEDYDIVLEFGRTQATMGFSAKGGIQRKLRHSNSASTLRPHKVIHTKTPKCLYSTLPYVYVR